MNIARNMLTVLALGMGVTSGNAFAAAPWTGTADYKLAPGALGDEDKVGPFSIYDLAANSPVLLKPLNNANPFNPSVGNEFQGYYQSFVSEHQLDKLGVSSPNLNTTGVGNGYELTVAANFKEKITGVFGNNFTFDVTGGDTKFYFDTSPDYDFNADSGFTNGSAILSGTILNGSGALLNGTLGVTKLNMRVDSYDTMVFDPDTIVAGSSIFSLELDPTGNPTNITSVLGHNYNAGADVLLMADGNFALAVPELSTYIMMLMGIGMVGVMAVRRRNT